ncbi:hypothetical protein V8C86DRAFT_3178993 [Haematococcus lacustris]
MLPVDLTVAVCMRDLYEEMSKAGLLLEAVLAAIRSRREMMLKEVVKAYTGAWVDNDLQSVNRDPIVLKAWLDWAVQHDTVGTPESRRQLRDAMGAPPPPRQLVYDLMRQLMRRVQQGRRLLQMGMAPRFHCLSRPIPSTDKKTGSRPFLNVPASSSMKRFKWWGRYLQRGPVAGEGSLGMGAVVKAGGLLAGPGGGRGPGIPGMEREVSRRAGGSRRESGGSGRASSGEGRERRRRVHRAPAGSVEWEGVDGEEEGVEEAEVPSGHKRSRRNMDPPPTARQIAQRAVVGEDQVVGRLMDQQREHNQRVAQQSDAAVAREWAARHNLLDTVESILANCATSVKAVMDVIAADMNIPPPAFAVRRAGASTVS